jgi:hypothetical protein
MSLYINICIYITRDDTIQLLREKLSQAEKRQFDAEKIITDLNEGFSSISRKSKI